MKFIVFEGLDGSGKSSLMKSLTVELKNQAQDFVMTREPGGTPLAEDIRHLLIRTDAEAPVGKTEILLYEASRAQHTEKLILPALKSGKWVISDRYSASTVAFQAGGRSIPPQDVEWLNHFATSGLTPDLTVLLDLSVEESEKRRHERAQKTGLQEDRLEKEARDFHQRVRTSYLEQAKARPNSWLVLDSTQTPDVLFQKLLQHLRQLQWLK